MYFKLSSIIRWWIINDFKKSYEEIAYLINHFISISIQFRMKNIFFMKTIYKEALLIIKSKNKKCFFKCIK